MLRVTFLGHQGWLVATPTTRILVDPLLGHGFGHGGLLGVPFPPRSVDPAAFPSVDAVVITHEHDDHFDIPSLHRLDRGIRVLLSERSSVAARTILAEMGFVVEAIGADTVTAIGDLRWHAFASDHRDGDDDEWDVLPFLVHDTQGHGSFMSSVDVRPSPRMLSALPRLASPGVWAHADNLTSAIVQTIGEPTGASASDDAEALARSVARRHDEVASAWGPPLATLVCGAGWSFPRDREFLDRFVFPVEPAALAERLRMLRPGARIEAAVPGHGVSMERGRLARDPSRAGFVRTASPHTWPDRRHAGDAVRIGDYAPACGRTSISAADLAELGDALRELAAFLYARPIHRALASFSSADARGRRMQIGLALRVEGGGIVAFAHDATACRFVLCEGIDPREVLVSGIECWAADLLALLRGEIGPTALCYAGRLRVWNAVPELVRMSPHELWMFAHPLCRPDAALRLYRRLLAGEAEAPPRVPGPAHSL